MVSTKFVWGFKKFQKLDKNILIHPRLICVFCISLTLLLINNILTLGCCCYCCCLCILQTNINLTLLLINNIQHWVVVVVVYSMSGKEPMKEDSEESPMSISEEKEPSAMSEEADSSTRTMPQGFLPQPPPPPQIPSPVRRYIRGKRPPPPPPPVPSAFGYINFITCF